MAFNPEPTSASAIPPPLPPTAMPPPPPPGAELIGMTIDRYELKALIGEGGMGQVYSAVHIVTKRPCALKLLPENLGRQPDFVSRFHTEAQLLARLNHPNIVQIYTGGESQSRFFLEMELIDGGDLQKRVLDTMVRTNKGLPEEEAFRVTDGILAALEYAHKQGVIHRDLKPANVLLSQNGGVKVSDFGLATVVGEELHRTRVEASMSLSKVASMETVQATPESNAGSFAGTILYMSPQALKAERPDARDDLFSLGVTVYYMLVGRTPSVNLTPVSKQRKELKRNWDKFIAKCLAEDRADRFQNATEARAALASAGKSSSSFAAIAVSGVVLLAAAGGVVAYKYKHHDTGTTVIHDDNGNGGIGTKPPLKPDDHSTTLAPQKIAFNELTDLHSNIAPFSLGASSDSHLPVRYEVVSGPARINGSMLALTGPGLVTIRALQDGDATHASAPPIDRTFHSIAMPDGPDVSVGHDKHDDVAQLKHDETAQLKPQTIDLEPLHDRILNELPINIVAHASSSLPVVISVKSGPATVQGNAIHLTGPGKVTLGFAQAGDSTYQPANPIEASFMVNAPVLDQIKLALPNNQEMVFLNIPAGRATLGSPRSEIGREPNETQYPYVQREGVMMGRTEVTQAQYQAITGGNPSYFQGGAGDRPVEQIRYSDVADYTADSPNSFLGKLNELLKKNGYQDWEAGLPTEDEWEYACRAKSYTAYNNDTDLKQPTNIADIQRLDVYGKSETERVASKAPNAWGLYDMHGNVAEWTQAGALRGGSFRDSAAETRSASKLLGLDATSTPDRRFGFRVIIRHRPATP